MKVLLDSHTLVWALSKPGLLSPKVRRLLEDADTEICVSSASVWELFTKFRLGKLVVEAPLMADFDRHLLRLNALELPVSHAHARVGGTLKHSHKDPFDRILAAQSIVEKLPVATKDPFISALGAETIW